MYFSFDAKANYPPLFSWEYWFRRCERTNFFFFSFFFFYTPLSPFIEGIISGKKIERGGGREKENNKLKTEKEKERGRNLNFHICIRP